MTFISCWHTEMISKKWFVNQCRKSLRFLFCVGGWKHNFDHGMFRQIYRHLGYEYTIFINSGYCMRHKCYLLDFVGEYHCM